MQPMLMVTSPIRGLLYINGRLVGELSADRPVYLPVSAWNAVYLEHRPLWDGYLPMARGIAFTDGAPVPESVESQNGLSAVIWPNGVVEVELTPEIFRDETPVTHTLTDRNLVCRMTSGRTTELEILLDGVRSVHALPAGATPPRIAVNGEALYLTGETGDRRYALILSGDGTQARLNIVGQDIEFMESGVVRVLESLEDRVGHARLTLWADTEDGYAPVSTEMLWTPGAPYWPQTPEDTALCALESMMIGTNEETVGYFAPDKASIIDELRPTMRDVAGVIPLKYPPINGKSAVGAIRPLTDHLIRVQEVYYDAAMQGGAQGIWRLTDMRLSPLR